jgi:hypothetical protein
MADRGLSFCDSNNDSSVGGRDWCALFQTRTPAISIHTDWHRSPGGLRGSCRGWNFRWSTNMSRQEILTENAELLAVAVYLSHSAIQRSTRHPYRLADFYATAAQEGAVDCAN